MIIGGCLPVDLSGHRVGYPGLLVRGADTGQWLACLPPCRGEVAQDHRARPGRPTATPQNRAMLRYSTLADPSADAALGVSGYELRIRSRLADFLQLAHYHRMLEACGFGAEQALAGVIGTDDLFEAPVLAWADLGEPHVRTFSRSSPEGWRLRSLARALRPRARPSGSRSPPSRSSRPAGPIRIPNCWSAPSSTGNARAASGGSTACRSSTPMTSSLRIDKTPLDMREIATLRRHGIATITDLGDADLDQLLEWYLPEVTHRERRRRPDQGGGAAGQDAAGRHLVRSGNHRSDRGAQAEVEIDLDIESSADGRIYLWGFLVAAGRPRRGAIYHEFSRFDDLDDRPRLRLPSTRSPGCAALSTPRRRSRSSTTAATRLPRSASWPTASTTSCWTGRQHTPRSTSSTCWRSSRRTTSVSAASG